MGLLLSSAISIARGVLNDTTEGYRYSTADLLEYGNGALRSLAEIRPEWLTATVEITCEANKALQSIPATAHKLVSIDRIKNGSAVPIADKAALDAFMPGWLTATSAAAVNWMPDASNPRRFYVYPPAVSGQILEATVVDIPGPFTADQDTGLPETITEAVADWIIYMAESRDDEHVLSGRAQAFAAAFLAKLKGTA